MNPRTRRTDLEIPLPPMELRLMGDSDERFVEHAVELAQRTYRLGLRDDHRLLDVGCSVGRLATGLLAGTDFHGRYVGFDVMPKQVRWASKKLPPVAPDFYFRHADVVNDRYNPQGTVEPSEMSFPARTRGFHMATLYSIFTHFYREDIEIYLRELRRVLKPGGIVVASWFLYDDESLERAQNAVYPMVHRHDDVTIYNDPDDPLRAIAFDESAVREWVEAAGLEMVDIEYGHWNQGPGEEFQDLVVMRRPPKPDAEPTTAASTGASETPRPSLRSRAKARLNAKG